MAETPVPSVTAGTALSDSDLAELFKIASGSPEQIPANNGLTDRLLERAAVLGTFTPQQLLAGFDTDGAVRSALDDVLRDSVVVTQDGMRRWLLGPSQRLAALMRLGSNAESVLREMTPDKPDRLGQAVAALIRQQVPPVAHLSIDDLRSYVVAGEWLRGWSGMASESLPKWRGELQRRELLAPLEQIAADFVGREKDMAKLRGFVDVVPPESRFEGWGRWLRSLIARQKDPLVVYGIGGIGKSTLMAQFILTHAAATSERGFPFAYLDFDRPRLDPNNPAVLLSEVLEQVAAQFGGIAARQEEFSSHLRNELQKSRVEQRSRSSASDLADSVADSAAIENLTGMFASWMRDAGLAERPFLLVLDTFEEVQVRGASAVDSVFGWLKAMFMLPQLRVVISGRAELDDRQVTPYKLGNFDKPAALAFLRNAGLGRGVPQQIYDKVGGNPLALRLCVRLAQQHALGTVKKEDLEGWFGKKDGMYIQGYLYTRLLRHIGDKRIEKLAHPGLVLRRITPDIIVKVLAPAVGLDVPIAADDLYDALKSEVSLVSEQDGALVHRKDVRSVMLEMQRQDDLEKFRELNRRAVEYYEHHDPASDLSRRERTYHRLMLAEDDPFQVAMGIAREDLLALIPALDELPGSASCAVRALLGQALNSRERKMLPDPVWNAYAYRRSMALVAAGSPVETIEILQEREGLPEQGPMRYPLALALFNTLRWEEAQDILRDPIEAELDQPYYALTPREKTELRVRPLVEGGFLAWYLGDGRGMRKRFTDAEAKARDEQAPFLRLEARVGLLIATGEGHWRAVGDLVDEIDPRRWRQNLLTLRRLVFLGFAPPSLMRVAVMNLGVQLRSGHVIESLMSKADTRLSPELLELLKRALTEEEGYQADLPVMERLAGAELTKLAGSEQPVDVVPYLRGRFAPWKIPLRFALLASYPQGSMLIDAFYSVDSKAADEMRTEVRSPRALADALIDYADQEGNLVGVAHALLHRPHEPVPGVEALLKAINLYAAQLPNDGVRGLT